MSMSCTGVLTRWWLIFLIVLMINGCGGSSGGDGGAGIRSSTSNLSPPLVANLDLINFNWIAEGSGLLEGSANSVEANMTVQITNPRTLDIVTVNVDNSGAFTTQLAAHLGDALEIVVIGNAGKTSPTVNLDPLPAARWLFGAIGDSIAAATHTNDMCGAGKEVMECLKNRLGVADRTWSYAGGDKSWSIGRRAGYATADIVNVADDGEEWKDALQQSQLLFQTETDLEAVNQVFIGLGSNDICQKFADSYDGDLAVIEQHINDTLTYLTDRLAQRQMATVYMAGPPDLVRFRDLMVSRQHNFLFDSCQALWDVNINRIQSEARDSLCRGELGTVCTVLPGRLQDKVLNVVLDSAIDQNNVDEGACGRILNSANSDQRRAEARAFNVALTDLLARKANEYNGRNNVKVAYTNALFELAVEPHMVSQIDCYHPSRAGQLAIADTIWSGLNTEYVPTGRFYFDAFQNPDRCTQEFTTWGGECWFDGGDQGGFDSWITGDGWYRLVKDTNNRDTRWVERAVGDFTGKIGAWMSFKHQRVDFDDSGDRVDFFVYDADGSIDQSAGWMKLDEFKGSGVDVGVHNGKYYDLTPYLSADMRLRFQTNNARSMENGDGLRWDNVSIFSW